MVSQAALQIGSCVTRTTQTEIWSKLECNKIYVEVV